MHRPSTVPTTQPTSYPSGSAIIPGLLVTRMLQSSSLFNSVFPSHPTLVSHQLLPLHSGAPSHSKLFETLTISLKASIHFLPCLPPPFSLCGPLTEATYSLILQVPRSIEVRSQTPCCPLLFSVHHSFLCKYPSSF